jgi:hypothetical protein
MTKVKPPYVEIPISCPHCQQKQGVQVRAGTGPGGMREQTVRCVKCERDFDVKVPGEIVGGAFLERYSEEWTEELGRFAELAKQWLANQHDRTLFQRLVESGTKLHFLIPIE